MAAPMIVISCGKAKQKQAAPAGELYTGQFHRTCIKYARSIAETDDIYILSALHGLVPFDRIIEPYDLKMGEPGSITRERLWEQAHDLGVEQRKVTVIGGLLYANLARNIWPSLIVPFGAERGHKQWFQMMDAMNSQMGISQ